VLWICILAFSLFRIYFVLYLEENEITHELYVPGVCINLDCGMLNWIVFGGLIPSSLYTPSGSSSLSLSHVISSLSFFFAADLGTSTPFPLPFPGVCTLTPGVRGIWPV
jgi:hypothetical protein